jgi:hypothetical protein
VDFSAGTLFLRPSAAGDLYHLELRYDEERYRPRADYDPDRATVRLGVDRRGSGGLRVGGRDELAQTGLIELSPAVDLTLEGSLGAAEASFELGGLRLTELELATGASRTEVRFSRPNPAACRSARISAGAAGVIVKKLGNSGCRRWEVEGGVGTADLDLSGDFPDGASIHVEMSLGSVTLRIPRDLGVRLTASRFLSSFDPEGFVRDGRTFVSRNYDTASRRAEVRVESTLGEIRVSWL